MIRVVKAETYRGLKADAARLERRAAEDRARIDQLTKENAELSGEVTGLTGAISAAREAVVPVFLVFHRGRLHSVHGREADAVRAAETDPCDPAPAGRWTPWAPVGGDLCESGWSIRRVGVHGLLTDVHALAAGVHGAPKGGEGDG